MCCAKSLQSCLILCGPVLWSPLSMGFSRQEYWSGLPCPPPGDLPHPGIKPASLTSPALAGGFSTTSIGPQILSLEALHHSELLSFTSIFLHTLVTNPSRVAHNTSFDCRPDRLSSNETHRTTRKSLDLHRGCFKGSMKIEKPRMGHVPQGLGRRDGNAWNHK